MFSGTWTKFAVWFSALNPIFGLNFKHVWLRNIITFWFYMKAHIFYYKVYFNKKFICLSKFTYIESQRTVNTTIDIISWNMWNTIYATCESFTCNMKCIYDMTLDAYAWWCSWSSYNCFLTSGMLQSSPLKKSRPEIM